MKLKIVIATIFLQGVLILISASYSFGQNDSAALAAADTSRFSVNADAGWLLYNSYVAEYGTDSAQLELIFRHENNLDWSQEHYVGKIKYGALKPQTAQTVNYWLLNDQYALRIDLSGKCHLRLVTGNAPSANPAVIPLIVYYRK